MRTITVNEEQAKKMEQYLTKLKGISKSLGLESEVEEINELQIFIDLALEHTETKEKNDDVLILNTYTKEVASSEDVFSYIQDQLNPIDFMDKTTFIFSYGAFYRELYAQMLSGISYANQE